MLQLPETFKIFLNQAKRMYSSVAWETMRPINAKELHCLDEIGERLAAAPGVSRERSFLFNACLFL